MKTDLFTHRLLAILATATLFSISTSLVFGQTEETTPAEGQAVNSLELHQKQDAIAQKFKRFERLLLQMAEYMRKTDPEQADLLVRGIGQSKSDRISGQMAQIVTLLEQQEFGDAMDREEKVIESLQSLLDLLQSGDRRSELQKEQERIQQILKDLNITIGKTKDARASNERGDNIERAVDRQEIAQESGQKLIGIIDEQDAERKAKESENEDDNQSGKPQEGESGENGQEGMPSEGGQPSEKGQEGQQGESGEGKPSDPGMKPEGEKSPKEGDEESEKGDQKTGKESDEKPDGEKGEAKPGEGKPKESQSGKPSDSESPSGESQPSESESSESQSGKPQQGSQQQGQPPKGESQEGEQSGDQPSEQEEGKTPGRNEIAQAVEKMERAIQELKKKDRDNASREQSEAIAKLEEAKAKLEEILRQLREEEKELLLAALEARFQKMLAMQVMVYTGTVNLDKTPAEEWTSRHHARSRELAQTEDEIGLEAAKALDLLKAEGSSIAFPEAIEQMRSDMLTVARRLEQSQAGELTQVIEEDLIEALQEIIESLQKEMEKSDEEKEQQQQQQQQQQTPPQLVDKLAELKMLRSLQLRINRRTRVLARKFRGEAAQEADVVDQLHELSRRQSRIQKTTYDLATGRNR